MEKPKPADERDRDFARFLPLTLKLTPLERGWLEDIRARPRE